MGSPASSIAGGGSGGSASGGSGDVTGPASSTDNAIARFDGVGGKTLQNSSVLVGDTGNVTLPARLLGKQGADVPSATDIELGAGNYFIVTGTTSIQGIVGSGWTAGSVVVLQFAGILTVAHAGSPDTADPLSLAGGVDYITTAGDTLTVVRDEATGVWREISRSVTP